MFFVRTRRTDDAGVRGRAGEEQERERERGRAATRARRRRRGARCGREKSFNVKVTWAHAHRIDRTQERDRAEMAKRKGETT